MRIGKKPNVVEAKKTRSCVVRLEKVTQHSPPPISSSFEESQQQMQRITRNNRLSISASGATPKGRKGVTPKPEEKPLKGEGPIKKRPAGGTTANTQTPPQKSPTAPTPATSMSGIKSNQNIKFVKTNRPTPRSTPARDETPPPTVAAGRSRRAIKPNPKYASGDLVTPKIVRNVALGSSASIRGLPSSAQSSGGDGGKQRKMSTSSDDFYNRNSDDDFENEVDNEDDDDNLHADKPYKASEKEELDSDFSDSDEIPTTRLAKLRRRPRKSNEISTQQISSKSITQTPISNVKRTQTTNTTNLRSAPSQLQQIRRSLANANAQRNLNLLGGSGTTSSAQKRKLDDSQDSSENESSFTITRKRMLLSSTTGGVNIRQPIKDSNKVIVASTSTPINTKQRVFGMTKVAATSTPQQQTLNGGNKVNSQMSTSSSSSSSRKVIEIPAKTSNEDAIKMSMRSLPTRQPTPSTNVNQTNRSNSTMTTTAAQKQATQSKILAAKIAASATRLRSGSPKPMAPPPTQKESPSNIKTQQSSPQNSLLDRKKLPALNNSNKTKSTFYATPTSSVNFSSSRSSNNTITTATHAKSLSLKPKSTASQSLLAPPAKTNVVPVKTIEIQDDSSPNSTMDDFETMPTFTIVNVNDIINKKGDVLITKSKGTGSKSTVIEFTESISLDDDEELDNADDDDDDVIPFAPPPPPRPLSPPTTKSVKLPTLNNKKELETKKSPLTRSSESLRKTSTVTQPNSSFSSSSASPAPQILNHKLGLRHTTRVTPKTTTTLTLKPPDKPAPRILNSVVAKKTQPVKPMIANLDDSADESFPLSLDEDEEEEEDTEDEVESKPISRSLRSSTNARNDRRQQSSMELAADTEDTESQNTDDNDSMIQLAAAAAAAAAALTPKTNTLPTEQQQRKKLPASSTYTPIAVSKKRMAPPLAAKENSLAATNQQVSDVKSSPTATLPTRKNAEKVVISKQGDKIIKKITCFETWYVINMPLEPKRHTVMKNQFEMPLIRLANKAKSIELPTDLWSCRVTLYELSAITLSKTTLITYTGDLREHNISEEDRGKYQPSCVMFRRSVDTRVSSRMPYDRAVIFKNKTFYTNIEGKNVRLVGAPSIINSEKEIEILLEVVDSLTLQSEFVEHVSIVQ